MRSRPTGTVTFLFTDIEGSTRLVQALGERYRSALELHHAILRQAIESHRGLEVSTEGDAFFAVFPLALDAVNATVTAQRVLAATEWPDGTAIRVRMGLHTGEGLLGGDNYIGIDVHRAARVAAAAHGGQVLLSDATSRLVEQALPDDIALRDMGRHWLKDLQAPEHLYQVIIDGLPADFPAPRSREARPTNLVPPRTPFVGRAREMAAANALLAGSRLLTFTGPGGTGKTRLAIELGDRVADRFADGVFIAPLEAVTTPAVVTTSILGALGTRGPTQGEPEEALVDYLTARQLLLILDNFEQVLSAAPLVSRLLSAAAGLRVVVTSRVPLHLAGEQEYPVPPLEVPEPDVGGIEALADIEAVTLFVERARRVRPDFRLTDGNAAAVAAICRRLDGLPLAIELAAARTKLFSPVEMLARLERTLPLLAGGGSDLPERQRTLRATIDWSCRLLDPSQRVLLARLSVFMGGWTLDAAEHVANPDGTAGEDVLDGLASLIDHSLVRAADDPSGESRFEMLQLIREYAAERLAEAGESDRIARRHAEWCLALVEAGVPALEAGNDSGWVDRLAREHDNLRAALLGAEQRGDRAIALRIATATWRFWQQRGHIPEGREWFERLLPSGNGEVDLGPAELGAAHTAAGGLAYWQNAIGEAEAHYRRALDLYQRDGIADRLGDALYNLAFVAMASGDLEAARRLFTESADAFVAAGQAARLGDTTAARGALEMRAGNLEEARNWIEEGRRLNLERGNRSRATDGAMALGSIQFRLGDRASAHDLLLAALGEIEAMGDMGRWPGVVELGSWMALASERPRDALVLASAAARSRAELGNGPPNYFVDIGRIVAEGRAAVAERWGPAEADAAWEEGRLLDNEAIAALLRR